MSDPTHRSRSLPTPISQVMVAEAGDRSGGAEFLRGRASVADLALLAAARHLARAVRLYAVETKVGLHPTGAGRRRGDLRGRARTRAAECRRVGCIALAGAIRALRPRRGAACRTSRLHAEHRPGWGGSADIYAIALAAARVRVLPHRTDPLAGAIRARTPRTGRSTRLWGAPGAYQAHIRLIGWCVSA